MIDLNSPIYSENLEKEILSKYSHYQIFKYYIPELKVGKAINSPIRKDDIPSFSVFPIEDGTLLYKDFRLGDSGDCFKLVQELFSYSNRTDAIKRVMFDFGMIQYENNKEKRQIIIPKDVKIETKSICTINIKTKPFTKFDLEWWQQYNITEDILKKYNVFRCQYVFRNGKGYLSKDNDPAYAYIEAKDGEYSYKIYRPLAVNKLDKWLSNIDRSVWQGWTQLPKEGKNLIITKSYKDIMSIVNTTNIAATAMQNESTIPKPQIIKELASRFENIYILYDNDFDKTENWGQLLAEKLIQSFLEQGVHTHNIVIPFKYLSKDFSDLIKNKGINIAKKLIKNEFRRSISI